MSAFEGPAGAQAFEGTTLPPIRVPFTVLGAAGGGPASAENLPSWGRRLGLWWGDSEEPGGGVVVTGMLKEGPLARSLSVGDVIVGVDDEPVRALGDLTRYLDRFGAGVVRLSVRDSAGLERAIAVRLPDSGGRGGAAPGGPSGAAGAGGPEAAPGAAHIPVCTLLESLSAHIQLVLSHPLQREVTHPGVSAAPEFGCLGADLDFSVQSVGLSEIRNAIVRCETRLLDVEVDAVDLEIREEGETVVRPGVRVTGKLAGTGEADRKSVV